MGIIRVLVTNAAFSCSLDFQLERLHYERYDNLKDHLNNETGGIGGNSLDAFSLSLFHTLHSFMII